MEVQKAQNDAPTVQNLKSLLTDILLTNTAYDCMPINSLISSIDKSISLFDAVNILLSEQADQLMVWDQQAMKWIWMLTLVDATRLILHALRTYAKLGRVDFSSFENRTLPDFRTLPQCTVDQIQAVVKFLKEKKLNEILKCLIGQNETKSYVRLKSVMREAKLSYVILTMIVQKIHRILVEDSESKMIISVLNFKDVLLYLLRIANESNFDSYSTIQIYSLLQNVKLKENTILSSRPIWQAFQMMVDGQRSLWINVVDQNMKFKGMLFRQDFRDILMTWRLDSLWKSAGEFLQHKKNMYKGSIPEFRYFHPHDSTKDIIWKIVMTRKNAIIWVDQQGKIKATIGLMELFSLYVQ